MRSFTIVKINSSDRRVKSKSVGGRFQSADPASAAKKAGSSICRLNNINSSIKFKVAIKETTQGSANKVFVYSFSRVRNPRTVLRSGKEITYEFETKVKSLKRKSNRQDGLQKKNSDEYDIYIDALGILDDDETVPSPRKRPSPPLSPSPRKRPPPPPIKKPSPPPPRKKKPLPPTPSPTPRKTELEKIPDKDLSDEELVKSIEYLPGKIDLSDKDLSDEELLESIDKILKEKDGRKSRKVSKKKSRKSRKVSKKKSRKSKKVSKKKSRKSKKVSKKKSRKSRKSKKVF